MRYESPFPGGDAETEKTGRDQNACVPYSTMQPTPPEPANRAHCCECNARELEQALVRQERSNRDDQYRTIINAAVAVADQTLGEVTDEARQFLAELFRREYNQVKLPKF